jgi:site-specific DNA-cytosine methylase
VEGTTVVVPSDGREPEPGPVGGRSGEPAIAERRGSGLVGRYSHASFFSGVGGLDLGLERAGWRTVSFSEVDPYASAVLAARWPGVPNLGSILDVVDRGRQRQQSGHEGPVGSGASHVAEEHRGTGLRDGWSDATLWSGGFPCQGLSVAGKRRGLADERSGLAFAFLDLVGRHRPPWVLLENVPGLLSSHAGRDLGALLGALGELGYGWAYRVLDARHFGVPQRRRRVFILAHTVDGHPDADGPAAVLAVGTRCRRHPPTGIETGEEPAPGARAGVDIARAVTGTSWKRHDDDTDTLIASAITSSAGHHGHSSPRGDGIDNLVVDRPPPDPDGVRAPDGLAGRMDGGDGLAATLNSGGNAGGFRTEPGEHLVVGALREHVRPGSNTDHTVLGGGSGMTADEPDGLDSHRYRCCGNGVVSSVAEWIGLRLRQALE